MPMQIERDKGGVVVIRAEGKLVKEDYSLFVPQFERIVNESGKLRVLFDMTKLDGWDSKGIWEEAKFDLGHNGDIRRLAVVGEEKWHHALVGIAKPFAAAEVRYFHRDESDEAGRWLSL